MFSNKNLLRIKLRSKFGITMLVLNDMNLLKLLQCIPCGDLLSALGGGNFLLLISLKFPQVTILKGAMFCVCCQKEDVTNIYVYLFPSNALASDGSLELKMTLFDRNLVGYSR